MLHIINCEPIYLGSLQCLGGVIEVIDVTIWNCLVVSKTEQSRIILAAWNGPNTLFLIYEELWKVHKKTHFLLVKLNSFWWGIHTEVLVTQKELNSV